MHFISGNDAASADGKGSSNIASVSRYHPYVDREYQNDLLPFAIYLILFNIINELRISLFNHNVGILQ